MMSIRPCFRSSASDLGRLLGLGVGIENSTEILGSLSFGQQVVAGIAGYKLTDNGVSEKAIIGDSFGPVSVC
jgi:hypothetical protein